MCLDKDKYDSRPVLYNSKRSTMYYKRGEVYYIIDDGRCIGNEIMKTRPAVIVSDSSVNKNLDVLVVVPLSSKVKKILTNSYPSGMRRYYCYRSR